MDGNIVGPRDTKGSKLPLPENGSSRSCCFLRDIIHHPKEGTGKLKQAWKARSEPSKKPTECPRASKAQPRPWPQTDPKLKGPDLTSLVEKKRGERSRQQPQLQAAAEPQQGGEGQLAPHTELAHPMEHTHSSNLVLTGSPQPRDKSKKNRNKGDGASSSLHDVSLPKDTDLDSVDMDETKRKVFQKILLGLPDRPDKDYQLVRF